jgi:hypothetical protein
MKYPKINKYKNVYIEIGADISVVIDELLSVKNSMFREGFTDVMVNDVEHGLVSFQGERDMRPEESSEYTRRCLSQEAIDRTTYVELKLKYGWS